MQQRIYRMNLETEDQTPRPTNEPALAPAAARAGTGSCVIGETPTKLPCDAVSTGEGGASPSPEPPLAPTPTATATTEKGAPAKARKGKWFDWRIVTVLLLAGVFVSIWRATVSHAKVQRPAVTPALPVVAVARVQRRDLYNEATYYAEFRPFQEVDLHAKVSGYVKEIYVDFGDKVKAGQLLAKLEIPELQDELNQAISAEERAEADYTVAHKAYTRLLSVDQQNPNLVVQQELDAAEGKDLTTKASIASAKAEVEKYQTLLGYTRITAPFDGVITHRYADPGALIQAGISSDTQAMPLVRISDNYRLRLDFPVDLRYVTDIRPGEPVEVWVDSLGKNFKGKITRCTHRIMEETRKMTTEIEVPNPELQLVPGMYARAVQKVNKRSGALSIPIEAVSSDKDPTVYVVNPQQQIEERPVTLGLVTADRCEVTAGLKEGDLVMIGSRAEVKPGEKVTTKIREL